MGFTYKSYNFIDKDPVIYEVWDALQHNRVSFAQIERESGVGRSTLRAWFFGETRRPQHATVRAVLRAAGLDYKMTKTEQPIHPVINIPKPERRGRRPRLQVIEGGKKDRVKPGEKWKRRLQSSRARKRAHA